MACKISSTNSTDLATHSDLEWLWKTSSVTQKSIVAVHCSSSGGRRSVRSVLVLVVVVVVVVVVVKKLIDPFMGK